MFGIAIVIGLCFGLISFCQLARKMLSLIAANPVATANAKPWLKKAFGHNHPLPEAQDCQDPAPHQGD